MQPSDTFLFPSQSSALEERRGRKRALRDLLLRQRRALTPEARAELHARWTAVALDWLPERLRAGDIVAAYWPLADELDVRPLLEALHGRGVGLALPVIVPGSKQLSFCGWNPGDALEPGTQGGLLQPLARSPLLTPTLLLVPLLGFDNAGRRLGFGGGYYDATLAALRAGASPPLAIGCAYAFQQTPEPLHEEPHDQRLNAVITEQAVVSFAGSVSL